MNTQLSGPPHAILAALLAQHLPGRRSDQRQRFADVLLALVLAQHVSHRKLAQHLPGDALPESKEKRVARFFASETFTQHDLVRLVLPLLGTGKLTLVMDRTNWKFGQHDHNVLVIGVLFAGYAVPLVWQLLDHGGASSTAVRIALLDRLLSLVSHKRVRVFLADREFVGAEWFAALKRRRVKRCIRLRDDSLLDDFPVRQAFADLRAGEVRGLLEPECVYGTPMQVVATLSSELERVVVASDLSLFQTLAEYKKRFSIECTFGAYKLRGLNLEATHMTQPARLDTLVGVLTLAFVWALLVGQQREVSAPVKVKGHGRKAKSTFLYGLDWLADALKWHAERAFSLLALLSPPRSKVPENLPVRY